MQLQFSLFLHTVGFIYAFKLVWHKNQVPNNNHVGYTEGLVCVGVYAGGVIDGSLECEIGDTSSNSSWVHYAQFLLGNI